MRRLRHGRCGARQGQVSRLPFAFAGDEFQTLNPTGFRWDAVKAAFVEKLIFELAPQLRREGAELNYHELRFNCRSATPIVHFCNLVQAVRAACFAIHELRPQRAWAPTDGAPPVLYFDARNGEFWNAFRDAAAGYVIIVTCLEGEEADFVRNDPVLRERVPFDDEVPRNVPSAGRAKGCEYPAVIVYGFGEALDTDIVGGISAAPAEVDARRTLTLQYFVKRASTLQRSSRRPRPCGVLGTTLSFSALSRNVIAAYDAAAASNLPVCNLSVTRHHRQIPSSLLGQMRQEHAEEVRAGGVWVVRDAGRQVPGHVGEEFA